MTHAKCRQRPGHWKVSCQRPQHSWDRLSVPQTWLGASVAARPPPARGVGTGVTGAGARQTLTRAGLQVPKASPPSAAVTWSLNPGGAAGGETQHPGPPRATQGLCGSLWAPGAGLRLALTAQKPEGPAGESALKGRPGAFRLGESVLSLSWGFPPRGVGSESPSGGFPPRGVGSESVLGLPASLGYTRRFSASLLGGGAEGVDSMKACVHTGAQPGRNAQGHSRNFHKMSVLVSELCGSVGTPAQPAHGGRALGVDGDHLPAAAPDQQHPVQPLGQDLEELHVCSGAELRMQPTSQCMPRAHLTSQELCGQDSAGGGGSRDPGPSGAGDRGWARGTVHPPGPQVCPATMGCGSPR